MSKRTIWWIVASAVLVHAALFLYLGRERALPRVHSARPPSFKVQEEKYQDPVTGERVTFREISVSTQLADPATLPPPPQTPATRPGATPAPAAAILLPEAPSL